jgi:hypothetical protein
MVLSVAQSTLLRPRLQVRLETPDEGGNRAGLGDQIDGAAGVVDGRFDLAAMAHDPGISQQAGDVLVAEARDFVEIEAGEGLPEILALSQDRQPRQAGLEAFEADLLIEAKIVGDRPTPFAVVVGRVFGRATLPEAARPAVLAGDQPVRCRHCSRLSFIWP